MTHGRKELFPATMDSPPTPSLVSTPSTARSSFSMQSRPQMIRQHSWKRHASLELTERPVVLPGPPPPAPPRVHTPPSSPTAPYAYPFLPSHEPRGEDRPSVSVEENTDKYVLVCRMPHFDHSSITVATRRGRTLVITADRWDVDVVPLSLDPALIPTPAHFERRITFGWDADMQRIRAEFDGLHLNVTVPRRQAQTLGLCPHPSRASAPASTGRDVAWPLG